MCCDYHNFSHICCQSSERMLSVSSGSPEFGTEVQGVDRLNASRNLVDDPIVRGLDP